MLAIHSVQKVEVSRLILQDLQPAVQLVGRSNLPQTTTNSAILGVRVREVQLANVSEEGLTHNLIDKGLNRSARYTAAKV